MRIIRKPLKVTPRKKLRSAAQRAAKYAEEDYLLRSQTSNYRGPSSWFCCFTLSPWAEFSPSVRLRIIKPVVRRSRRKLAIKRVPWHRGTGREDQGRWTNLVGKRFLQMCKNWWKHRTPQEAAGRNRRIMARGGRVRRRREDLRGPKRR